MNRVLSSLNSAHILTNTSFSPLKPKRERERVRKYSGRVEAKRKHLGESEWRFISGGGWSILLEGTQAMPARPSDKDKIKVKRLRW
jgi:hypothetical protein